MSLPAFPATRQEITIGDSISQILASIAMEEVGLSHILNTEGEKMQYLLGTLPGGTAQNPTVDELLKVTASVDETLAAVSMNQMFLLSKMSSALTAYFKNGGDLNPGRIGAKQSLTDPVADMPSVAAGRTLTPEQTGDRADWIELAVNGDYSLIMRTAYLNINKAEGMYGEPRHQYTAFGLNGQYISSEARRFTNLWFGNIQSQYADNLPPMARLREFTVKNNALSKTGSNLPNHIDRPEAYSKPIGVYDPIGSDVAFALSMAEAASFVSKSYVFADVETESSASAAANFEKLVMPYGNILYDRLWLRTPGDYNFNATALYNNGKACQTPSLGGEAGGGLIYPVLWVSSAIFD